LISSSFGISQTAYFTSSKGVSNVISGQTAFVKRVPSSAKINASNVEQNVFIIVSSFSN